MQLNWFRAAADRLYCSSAIVKLESEKNVVAKKEVSVHHAPFDWRHLVVNLVWICFQTRFLFFFCFYFFTALIKEIDPYYFQEHKQKKNLQTHMNIVGHWIILSYHKVYFCTSEFISHSVFCSLLFLCICTKMFSQFKNKV